MYLDS